MGDAKQGIERSIPTFELCLCCEGSIKEVETQDLDKGYVEEFR